MKSILPALMLFAIVALFLAVIGLHEFGYELGLKKPKYKVGQCVQHIDEFGDIVGTSLILKISNSRYKYAPILEKYVWTAGPFYYLSEPVVARFWIIDYKDGKVISCPEFTNL